MNNKPILSQQHIENRIFTTRGLQLMVDYHLAELFNVETKRLNEQVKRNSKRFPIAFMFQLSLSEWENLQSQIATAKRRTLPYVFTKQEAFSKSHDRFLIIDESEVYHLGASLKDLGKKPVVSLSNHGLLFLKWIKLPFRIF